MKVRTSSWHYKIVDLFDFGSDPKSLCSYFWRVVGNSLLALILGVLLIVFLPFWGPIIGTWFVLTKIFGEGRVSRFFHKERSLIPKSPGLFYSYYRAVKDKVCPLIEYEYE